MSPKRIVGAIVLGLAVTQLAECQEPSLQPGERLTITCASVPEMCVIRVVDQSGIVWLPGLGAVPAIEMSLHRFQTRLETMLSDRAGRPISARVDRSGVVGDPIRIVGLPTGQASRGWHKGMRLSELLREFSVPAPGPICDVYGAGPDEREFVIDSASKDLGLRPGDWIVVHQAIIPSSVVVVGPVRKPGVVPFKPSLTLASLIVAAGGLTGHADSHRLSLVHVDGQRETLDLLRDGGRNLVPGDSVSVGSVESREFVSISGPLPHPGLIEFRPGMRLTEAISAGGGDAMKLGDSVKIIRVLDATMRTTKYHLHKIAARIDEDPVLRPSDSIIVGLH